VAKERAADGSAGRLKREAVVAQSATTGVDGKTYDVEQFNLGAIISLGYRVKSHRVPNSEFGVRSGCANTSSEKARKEPTTAKARYRPGARRSGEGAPEQ
jgi:hypothetical protein